MLKIELTSALFCAATRTDAFEMVFPNAKLNPIRKITKKVITSSGVKWGWKRAKHRVPTKRRAPPKVTGFAKPWASAKRPANGAKNAPQTDPGKRINPATVDEAWRTYWAYRGITSEIPMLINWRLK